MADRAVAGHAAEHPAQAQHGRLALGGAVTPPGMSQIDTSDNTTVLFPPDFSCPSSEPGAFQCDRITAIIPVLLASDVRPQMGFCYWVDASGAVESFRHRRQMVEGSWSSRVSVEVHDCARLDVELLQDAGRAGLDLCWLRLDGNPAKFFQPFNVFGSPDVYSLYVDFASAVIEKIGLKCQPVFARGYFNRLDATFNFDLGSFQGAASLVRQLGRFATVAHRRSSGFSSSLLFPGRGSSLSIYHKGPELKSHPPSIDLPALIEVADRIVRFEVVSRSERLDAMGLRKCAVWRSESCAKLFSLWQSFINRLRFPVMGHVDLTSIPAPARRLYGVWLSGADVHAVASRMTVYRHRLAILRAGGPDIALPKPSGDVVEFRRTLLPVPAAVPADLAGYLYRPRAA
jgi:hypothetical protein